MPPGRPAQDGPLWRKVDELIDRAPSEDDLRSHKLEVLAAKRFRALGRPVPDDFAAQERFAAIASLTAPLVLQRIREAYDGPAIVIKGPEVAARYPDPAMRGYGDLDLLVPDAEAAHRALLAAGFQLVGDPELYVGIHHLRPLLAEGMPLPVEVHSVPKWPLELRPPSSGELFEIATPGTTGVDGMFALPAEHHTLVLAMHSWAHEPLRRLGDIVDIAAMAMDADLRAIARLARSWGVEKIWNTTLAAADAVLADGPATWALRVWAQNLRATRERTVLENHMQRWVSDFWALPLSTALARVPATFVDELRPGTEERWRTKLTRASIALRHAARSRSYHHQALDERSRSQDDPSRDTNERSAEDRSPT